LIDKDLLNYHFNGAFASAGIGFIIFFKFNDFN